MVCCDFGNVHFSAPPGAARGLQGEEADPLQAEEPVLGRNCRLREQGLRGCFSPAAERHQQTRGDSPAKGLGEKEGCCRELPEEGQEAASLKLASLFEVWLQSGPEASASLRIASFSGPQTGRSYFSPNLGTAARADPHSLPDTLTSHEMKQLHSKHFPLSMCSVSLAHAEQHG